MRWLPALAVASCGQRAAGARPVRGDR